MRSFFSEVRLSLLFGLATLPPTFQMLFGIAHAQNLTQTNCARDIVTCGVLYSIAHKDNALIISHKRQTLYSQNAKENVVIWHNSPTQWALWILNISVNETECSERNEKEDDDNE